MKRLLAIAVLMGAITAITPVLAQTPTVGGKPLVQVKPRATGKLSIAEKLLACLEIEDGSKGRLDCYDAVIAPKPSAKPAKAKGVAECRFYKEEDERLACFNGFAESIPKFSVR